MDVDLLLWMVRAIIIIVAIVLGIAIWRGKKEGKYQEIYLLFLVIGTTAFVLGIILLIVFLITDLLPGVAEVLTALGAIIIIIGLVLRSIKMKAG